MIDLPVADAPPQPTRRRWTARRLVALIAAIVVVAAGAITTTVLVRHYRNAPILECQCSLVWDAVDVNHEKDSSAAGYTQATVPARPNTRQAFYVGIFNPSKVTQTILGLPRDESGTIYRPRIGVSTRRLEGTKLVETQLHYAPGPVSLAPDQEAVLRFSLHATCIEPGGTVYWTDLDLRVRVGAFIRTESVDLAHTAMAISGDKASSRCPR
jgi:hypothetical protein